MSTSLRLTLDQFDAMIRRGDFEPRERHHVELIHGEVRAMSPIGPPHAHLIGLLTEWSIRSLPEGAAWVRTQLPIGIPALDSEPEPDIVWVSRQDFSGHHPRPDDVLLVIEVADSSLAFDRGEKAELYAAAGVADYWIVNLPGRCLEVRREPREATYHGVTVYHPGQEVRPLAFPDVALPVSRLFPQPR